MSVRAGEAWTARNGHRRWVSMGLGDVLALGLLGAWLVLPLWLLWWMLVAEAVLAAEAVVFAVTGIMALAVVAGRGARFGDVTLARLRWGLVMINLKGKP